MNWLKRRKARCFAVQAIYQWQVAHSNIIDVVDQFITDITDRNSSLMLALEDETQSLHLAKFDKQYFQDLLIGVANNIHQLDKLIIPHLNRELAALDNIEKAILRLAIYELMYRQDVPLKVIINEAVEIAKVFGGTDGHRFINGILAKIVTLHPRSN